MVVESPKHLFDILSAREEVLDIATGDVFRTLRFFMDSVESYEKSCCCEKEKSRLVMVGEYEVSIRQDSVLDYLRASFGCDEIRFVG